MLGIKVSLMNPMKVKLSPRLTKTNEQTQNTVSDQPIQGRDANEQRGNKLTIHNQTNGTIH